MMEWFQITSFFLTNGIRIYLGLLLVTKVLNFTKSAWKAAAFSFTVSALMTSLSLLPLSQFYLLGIELFLLLAITHYLFQKKPRMRLFLIFFYEIGTALWEFLISSGLGILFHSEKFIDPAAMEYMAAVWVVRILMVGIAVYAGRDSHIKNRSSYNLAAIPAVLGLFGVILLEQQSVILLNNDQLATWMILSLILMFSILFFNLNRQYEMEKEIAGLKSDQTELLERSYQMLNKSYTANATLFHDLHNHVEVMHRYLIQGKTAEAISYLEDLRTPLGEIDQTTWTGDEAIDNLVNSKILLAEQAHIVTSVNIEFPRNINIRSADLTTILGNLLDNALEAAENSRESLRFIQLTIRRINHMLLIKVKNGCEVMPVIIDGKVQSTKSDKGLHGWGLESARTAAGHYDGTIETSYEQNVFCAVAMLSYHALNIEES